MNLPTVLCIIALILGVRSAKNGFFTKLGKPIVCDDINFVGNYCQTKCVKAGANNGFCCQQKCYCLGLNDYAPTLQVADSSEKACQAMSG
uniref:Neurotoxin LmNaTx28 n=1 Tax=Lychas mucronatus TaxID=172552 RepID=SNA28_LYCMC|nr:RecName: Full=Neurotoxin LmNaTx28; Flags: Precursor [Lychas mucronatus]ABX76776.1 neurotoxin LmNaTx28 precursor [Lychas mucronatus]